MLFLNFFSSKIQPEKNQWFIQFPFVLIQLRRIESTRNKLFMAITNTKHHRWTREKNIKNTHRETIKIFLLNFLNGILVYFVFWFYFQNSRLPCYCYYYSNLLELNGHPLNGREKIYSFSTKNFTNFNVKYANVFFFGHISVQDDYGKNGRKRKKPVKNNGILFQYDDIMFLHHLYVFIAKRFNQFGSFTKTHWMNLQ